MFGNLGMTEILMLLLICLVLFGAKRIPEIGSSVGKGIREFKHSISGAGDSATSSIVPAPLPERRNDVADAPQSEPRRLL
jgi:sec-independent protein translocase protein TatA